MMKKQLIKTILILFVLSSVPAFADAPPWTGSETYTFDDTDDPFLESSITDIATVNILGGEFGHLHCYEYSTVNMIGGMGVSIGARDNSTINLSGGSLSDLYAYNSSEVHIFVLDYQINTDSYLGKDLLTGHWQGGYEFDILVSETSWPYVSFHIVPEPGTIAFLLLGIPFLKIRKQNR